MSTISVPLTPHLEKFLENYIKSGNASNKAEVLRRALTKFEEDEAVMKVLRAEQEVSEGKIIRGKLKDILR
jgi:putative addiction module CopG family antidote